MTKHLHDWIFHYNSYKNRWDATTRDNYPALFSGLNEGVISSSNFNTLIEIIEKTGGDKEKIKKLIKVPEIY